MITVLLLFSTWIIILVDTISRLAAARNWQPRPISQPHVPTTWQGSIKQGLSWTRRTPCRLFSYSLARFAVAPLWCTLLCHTPLGYRRVLKKSCCLEADQGIELLWKAAEEVWWRVDVVARVHLGLVRLYQKFSIRNLWVASVVHWVLDYLSPLAHGLAFVEWCWRRVTPFLIKMLDRHTFPCWFGGWLQSSLWLERNFPVFYFY